MQGLQTLINQIEKGRNIHISVHDLCGALHSPSTMLEFKSRIHSKRFCDVAKSTEAGFRMCLECKKAANEKASGEKSPFCGHCVYGLFEAAVPVIVKDSAIAVVYVGNAIIDESRTESRLTLACERSGADENELKKELENCERIDSAEELQAVGEIVSDYLIMLYNNTPKNSSEFHWLVAVMKSHAEDTHTRQVSLKELGEVYQKNEKYLGRLFKKEMGMSFDKYCMDIKMKKAENILLNQNDKIIDVALECGFNSISYFNRSFAKRYGMTPSQYRQNKGNIKP